MSKRDLSFTNSELNYNLLLMPQRHLMMTFSKSSTLRRDFTFTVDATETFNDDV